MTNFADILNKPVSEIERPPNVPVGEYIARVSKMPELGEAGQGKWKTIVIPMTLTEAMPNVDAEDLEKFGGLHGNPAASVRHQFMFSTDTDATSQANNERTQFNAKRFFSEHLKVEGDTLSQMMANSVGSECMVSIKWQVDKDDPEITYARIAKTAPINT